MPRADLTGEYRSDHGQSAFPKLRLQAGEKARVVVIAEPGANGVPQVFYEYVHRFEAPNIVNGAPTYIKIKTQEGGEAFKVEKRFKSNPLCKGDPDVLRERSLDVSACEGCRMAEEEPEIFWRPRPRYAANVIKYNLNPMGGGWNNLVNPYGVQIVVWVFSAKVMDKLIDIMQMGDAFRDPRMVDLLLECDKDGYSFQKPYSNGEFLPVAPALWLSNDQTRQYTGAVLVNNSASDDDLSASIGKQVKPEWMTDDIRQIMARWNIVRQYEARGSTSIGVPGFGAETLQQGLSQLQQQYGQPGMHQEQSVMGTQPPWTPQLAEQAGQAPIDRMAQAGNPLAGAMFPPGHPATLPGFTGSAGDAGSPLPGPGAVPPPSGLAGLEEFMRATSSNPALAAAPAPVVPPAQSSMPAAVPGPPVTDPLAALSGLTPASQVAVPPTAPGATMMPTAAPDAATPYPTAPLPAGPASGNGGDSRQYKFSDLVPPQDQP